jgi:hypothetical protein
MRIRTCTVFVVTLALLVSVAPAARAFDLTGRWVGKWKCKGFDGGKFTSHQKPSTLEVTQAGNVLAASIDGGSFFYNGTPVPSASNPDRGEVVLLACPTANTLGAEEAEIVRAVVKTKTGTAKAKFKGTSIFADDAPESGTCKYAYKRVDTVDPGVTPCP